MGWRALRSPALAVAILPLRAWGDCDVHASDPANLQPRGIYLQPIAVRSWHGGTWDHGEPCSLTPNPSRFPPPF